jgi:Uma2 family endonuclease
MDELLAHLGGISLHRVRMRPMPGFATEQDLRTIRDPTGMMYELVDGVLVRKATGYAESSLACWISHLLASFLDQHDLGVLAGSRGLMRLMPGLVRSPSVSFVRWEQLPGRHLPSEPIPDLAPALAVEVLFGDNTPGEMARKRREYFLSGTELVWMVDPDPRTVTVYTAPDYSTVFTEAGTLDGGNVLPGLAMPVLRIFEHLPAPPGAVGK